MWNPEDVGIVDQRGKIPRLEDSPARHVPRKRLLRQRVAGVVGAAGERGQRRRPVDRHANIGHAVGAPRNLRCSGRSCGAGASAIPASTPLVASDPRMRRRSDRLAADRAPDCQVAAAAPRRNRAWLESISIGLSNSTSASSQRPALLRYQPHPEEVARTAAWSSRARAVRSCSGAVVRRRHAAGSLRLRHCRRRQAIARSARNCRRSPCGRRRPANSGIACRKRIERTVPEGDDLGTHYMRFNEHAVGLHPGETHARQETRQKNYAQARSFFPWPRRHRSTTSSPWSSRHRRARSSGSACGTPRSRTSPCRRRGHGFPDWEGRRSSVALAPRSASSNSLSRSSWATRIGRMPFLKQLL